MANLIKDKWSSPVALTISLGSLASSTTGAGRQSTIVDNTSNQHESVLVAVSIKLGTSPVANTLVYAYLIRDDNAGTPIRSDGAGASDAAWTAKNAQVIGTLATGPSPATGDVLSEVFLVRRPGPKWGVGIVNSSGVPLNSTGGNHAVEYSGGNPEVQ
jgi:hypothetical protein